MEIKEASYFEHHEELQESCFLQYLNVDKYFQSQVSLLLDSLMYFWV